MQESVELPLTHPEYYEEMGIKPPKGVILYGAPGTGKNTHSNQAKTMLLCSWKKHDAQYITRNKKSKTYVCVALRIMR